ncbi:mRNA 3' end processing factor [Cladophialophora chaetospira]|uniref:mRNA 3' end processing factor n=1 Tax=Cladophialophora chaetospira TaxID=386627 RepID=A0AA38WVZ4_9EURO|nr:mRNA 3' end processing factor [Cladophialophora chaetospira]
MSGLPSDEVAEDYKGSLEDLVTNDRYQISNLTLIAKENIEHAEAISRVLQNHINRAPPARKLPALYVLDSIAKNVGSPYTVYFGRNLHQVYMLAYSQVDGAVRRKLEEMLKTWREPVPGSLSTTPVFPIASTQSIVDNLNKFRGATAPGNRYPATPVQGQAARVAAAQPYRQTPTPPQPLPQFPTNLAAQVRSPQPQATLPQNPYTQTPPVTYGQPYPPQPAPVPYFQPPPPTAQYPPHIPQPLPGSGSGVDLQRLHADIDDLTTDAKIDCATHPLDVGAQRKLASLQTLKEILDSGHASESDLVDIRNTIMQKMAEKANTSRQPEPAMQQLPAHYGVPQPAVAQHAPTPAPPPTSLFNSTNLAELLRATANQSQTTQPQNYYPPSHSGVGTPQYNTAGPPVTENPLIAQLRASGLLSAAPTPPQGVTPPFTAFNNFAPDATVEIKLTSASIRISRPQKVAAFLNARPNQCSTCGRRFTADETGKEKKARHLDWHFKTKARMLDAEKRGQNRSWYVDEREWIASKEYEDDAGPVDANGNATAAVTKKKILDYVRAPADPVLRSLPCPIDQEPFKSEWSEEVQDFIWKDAVQVGNRIYHLSCYNEVTKSRDKDGVSTPVGGIGRTATPDSVLGKRKAEQDPGSNKSRIKLEVAQA